jgi:hypothetical protein
MVSYNDAIHHSIAPGVYLLEPIALFVLLVTMRLVLICIPAPSCVSTLSSGYS